MKNTHEAHNRQYSMLHFINWIRGKGTPVYFPNPQAQNEHTENSTLQREAELSPIPTGLCSSTKFILDLMHH